MQIVLWKFRLRLALIFARSENRCVGSGGALPWSLPDEMAFFEDTTHGGTVIMGRLTFQDHESVLPGRENIVVTRGGRDFPAGIDLAKDLDSAIGMASSDRIFVIGGVSLWLAALPHATEVFESLVHAEIEGDTYLPELDLSGWETEVLLEHDVDARHVHAFTTYRHRRP